MTRYEPLRSSQHASAGFQRARDYSHAAQDRVAPVLIDELAYLIPYMPLGFVGDSEEASSYKLVAIQGLDAAVNLYVHPASQKWLTGYTPAFYRAYPFALGVDESAKRHVLCFDVLSGLLRESAGPQDTAFFDDQGNPTQAVKDTLEFLNNREVGLKRTNQAVEVLNRHSLLEPWPITIQKDKGKTDVKGLRRINSKKLLDLTSEALAELNACGALQIAYAQLFSMPQLKHLQKLAQLHGTVEPSLESGELDSFFDNDEDDDLTFNFDD
ncbi:SapC family protein [Halomonas sp. LS-001]